MRRAQARGGSNGRGRRGSGSLPSTEAPGDASREIIVRTLDQFTLNEETTAKTLLGIRWLCRGGSILLCGPTGIGKSSFAMQLAIKCALGETFFGIAASGKLKVLVIQAENDDGDQ